MMEFVEGVTLANLVAEQGRLARFFHQRRQRLAIRLRNSSEDRSSRDASQDPITNHLA